MRNDRFARNALILREGYVIIGAAIAGAILRIYQIENQILIGDEWHAIHSALYSAGYLSILSTLGSGGHAIPEALYYKFLIDNVGLSEFTIHIPFLIAGIATIIIIPLLVREIIGRYAANLLAWLLALSPLLTFYSRFARPYGIVVLLGFSTVVLFYKWWITGNRYYALSCVVTSILTVYFHIVSLPFVFGAYVYFFILSLLRNSGSGLNAFKRLLKIGSVTVIPLALMMSVPIFFSHRAIASKAGDLTIQVSSLSRALWILIGSTNSAFVVSGLAIVIGAGLFINIIRATDKRRFFIYLIFLSMIQIIFVVIAKPVAGNAPHILARYIILLDPVLLVLMASGITTVLGFMNIRVYLQVFLIAIFLSAYLLTGPIPSSVLCHSNASNLSLLVTMAYGKGYQEYVLSKVIKRIPVFYKDLAMFPANTLTLVEAPYHFNGYHIFIYQAVHRQNVLMGFINGLCSENRLDEVPYSFKNIKFRNFIFLKEPGLLHERGVNFVVFHKRLIDEIRDKPEHLHQDVSPCIEQYKVWFGVPAFEDQDIVVFSMKPEKT